MVILLPFAGGERSACADQPADAPASSAATDTSKTLPQGSFFSSLKQSFKQDFDRDVVRGHFDLGSPPNGHRYYCMIDTRTNTREPNGVIGDPITRKDGMTAVKNGFVSQYGCAEAEQQGLLVTSGYVLTGASAAAAAPRRPAQASAAPPPPSAAPAAASAAPTITPLTQSPSPTASAQPSAQAATTPSNAAPLAAAATAPAAPRTDMTLGQIDVAGVKLGMTPDDVRAVLKSKNLLDYRESAESLSYLDSAKGVMRPVSNGRFLSVIAAWTPPPATASADSFQVDGESYEVMFTPVPGKERAMAIVHSMGYSPANAIREVALENGLINKYGGFPAAGDLPESPTWRLQSGGNVQVGDPCGRRGTFGGIGSLSAASAARENLALKKTPDDFKSQVDHCGIAIVTEDHYIANGGALRDDRLVTRYTVTAYSPAIGLEGSQTAAQLVHAAGGSKKSDVSGIKDHAPPSL
jgi:hypothetical protein